MDMTFQLSLSNLQTWHVVDLTQPLRSTIPIWPGDPSFSIQPWASYTKDGYFINQISIGEHSGTHWATPNTFIKGATSADAVPVEKMIAPAVVIDIRDQAVQNPDYQLSVADVEAWEQVNGRVPSGSIVILFTGWQDKWNHPTAFFNQDTQGVMHFPGFGVEAVGFLISQRQIIGLGIDTHGADPGNDGECAASRVMYAANGTILECLGSLDQLPAVGATLVIGGLPIEGGSGSPARIFAFMPPTDTQQ
jgi:kynurenine formamidase